MLAREQGHNGCRNITKVGRFTSRRTETPLGHCAGAGVSAPGVVSYRVKTTEPVSKEAIHSAATAARVGRSCKHSSWCAKNPSCCGRVAGRRESLSRGRILRKAVGKFID